MKKSFLILIVILFGGTHHAWSQVELKAEPSQTVELMNVMFSLAGHSIAHAPHVLPEYKTTVDSYFAKYRDHSAIQFIIRIMETEYVDMVTPAGVGVNSDIIDGKFVYSRNVYRWGGTTISTFVDEVNKFYRDTKFDFFWERVFTRAYPLVIKPFNDNIIPKLNLEWLNRYVPVEGTVDYGLTISYLCGGYNFGVSRNGVPNPVLGVWDINMFVNPTPKTLEIYIPLTMHEYLHSFCNPLIDKYYSKLEEPGKVIFPKSAELLTESHYGNWRIALYESLVRASEIVFLHSDDFYNYLVESHIRGNEIEGFYWIRGLYEVLLEYESDRETYPTLDSFMPRVVDFFRELASKESINKNT